jgi:hypothetical protein
VRKAREKRRPKHIKGNVVERRFTFTSQILSMGRARSKVKISSKTASGKEKRAIQPCPNCGTKQNIAKPMEGNFPYQNCKSCKQPFHVNTDLIVRKLTDEERREIPEAWFQIVENISKKKVAVVFRLE